MAKVDYGHYWRAYVRKYEWHRKQAEKAGLKVSGKRTEDWRQFSIQIQAMHDSRGWSYDAAAAKMAQKAVYGHTLGRLRALGDMSERITGKRLSLEDASLAMTKSTIDMAKVVDQTKELFDVDLTKPGADKEIARLVFEGYITVNDANKMIAVGLNIPKEERAEWISQNIFGSK